MTEPDDLVGEIIAQVAREHGVALSRVDPILATVFLNQAILRRVLDQAVGPAVQAIAEAARDAVTHLQEHAEAQAHRSVALALMIPVGCSCRRQDSRNGDNLVVPRFAPLRTAAPPRAAPGGALGLRTGPTRMA